ncbi:hypothetical protein Trydic_g11704 [Trypoxylus dichotomus]
MAAGESVTVGDVTPQAREALKAVLAERAKCFSVFKGDLGLTHLGEMKMTTNTPVYYRPYRLAYSEQSIVRSKVQQLIESGVIRQSNSDYASPIILVPKKNGEPRLCVDYRALNRITVKDRYPLPLIDDLLDRLAGKRYYSTLDMASGYHKVPMHKESIHKTAFITPDGQYEYLRVPFGLMNAPAAFQRVINKMLGGMQHTEVLPYMDDILMPSGTVEDGLALLKRVLVLREKTGLKINLAKSSFLQTEIEYLGHELSAGGVRPSARKISVARGDWCLVLYFSKTTTPQEQAYHSYELETLAIVEAVKRFRVYLLGVHFRVITDCSAVRATMTKRDLVPRIARWWLALQEYDMDNEYRSGEKMRQVETLSLLT